MTLQQRSFPGLLVNLISESMNQALVPTLVRVRELEGRERAQQLLSSSMVWLCVLLVATSAVMAVSARAFFLLLGSRYSEAKLDLAGNVAARLCGVPARVYPARRAGPGLCRSIDLRQRTAGTH